MKKKLLLFLVLLLTLITTGCIKNPIESLKGNDLIAYNMMIEICYNADDPREVRVISGSVTDEIGVFKVSYGGSETYNILVSYKDGNYKVEKLYDQLAEQYKNLLYETDDFSANRVNRALKAKWEK